jgi:CHAD domain-containing protein
MSEPAIATIENSGLEGRQMSPFKPVGLRLREFACLQLAFAERQLANHGENLHDGIHHARKSLRRTRAVLALGASIFDHRAKALDAELRQLCHGLSSVRDAQALVVMLSHLGDDTPEVRPIAPDVIAAATRRRDKLLAGLLQRDPGMASRRKRIHGMRDRIAQLYWQSVDDGAVRHGLARSERRALKAESRAQRRKDDDGAWHAFRRRLRRLHQQNTLLGELAPELHSEHHRVEQRTDALGEAQDDVLLLARCRSHSPFAPAHRSLLRKIARMRLTHARS